MREMKSPCKMSKVLSLNYLIGDEVVFHNLWKSLDIFRNLSIWSCCLKRSWHSQDKNLMPLTQKKLRGICLSTVSDVEHFFRD